MAGLLTTAGAVLAAAIFLQYLVPALVLALTCRDADLKKKYGAEWGLVTGASSGAFFSLSLRARAALTSFHLQGRRAAQPFHAVQCRTRGVSLARERVCEACDPPPATRAPEKARRARGRIGATAAIAAITPLSSPSTRFLSGIGKALARKLASQGINVVLVALDDPLLASAADEIRADFPGVAVRAVGADLGAPGAPYAPAIAAATADITVQCVFLNAGYMVTGFFELTTLAAQLANLECNAVSAVALSHTFLRRLVDAGKPGCIVLTSSAAAAIASPFTALYAATKAFVSSFGASLAVEARHRGVDVLVFHPSPVASRFYDKAARLDVLDFFKGVAVHPDALPPLVFGSIGRTVWRDIGSTALGFRLLMKVVDYNLMATLTALAAPLLPDFKRAVAASSGSAAGAGAGAGDAKGKKAA
jgi:short-subunit dehydrogenase